jgi:ATP-binding cassette subfamily B (MDR/TAP) protein 1
VSPHFVTFSRASTAASELFSLIDRESEINPFDTSGERPAATSGNIEFEGVTFSYPTRPDVRVLEDFNLKVPAGKVTALVVGYRLSVSGFVVLTSGYRAPADLERAPLSDFWSAGITRVPEISS